MSASNGHTRKAQPAKVVTPRSAHEREQHLRWLLEVTQLPTASGRETRVTEWVKRWVAERADLVLKEDRAGNLVIMPRKSWVRRSSGSKGGAGARPIYFTAHLDHPAFVVERVIGPGTVELAFRGGVMDAYFQNARVVIHPEGSGRLPALSRPLPIRAVLTGEGAGVLASGKGERLFKTYLADMDQVGGEDDEGPSSVQVGDIAVWDLPPAEIDGAGIVHTHACDDLAALAAALSAFDVLRRARAGGASVQDVRLIFTRSEEIGFTGAIAACKLKTMPKNARVIALENSRSFADSPIGGGPIVRVGDRMSVFSPRLTAACARRAEQLAAVGGVVETQPGIKWQRKLMAGGACEATVFCAYGYEATCLCLPLGNYHNMSDLAEVQAGTHGAGAKGPARIGREFIARSDYEGLVELLVAIGFDLPEPDPAMARIEKLYEKHEFVLKEGKAKSVTRRAKASKPRTK